MYEIAILCAQFVQCHILKLVGDERLWDELEHVVIVFYSTLNINRLCF